MMQSEENFALGPLATKRQRASFLYRTSQRQHKRLRFLEFACYFGLSAKPMAKSLSVLPKKMAKVDRRATFTKRLSLANPNWIPSLPGSTSIFRNSMKLIITAISAWSFQQKAALTPAAELAYETSTNNLTADTHFLVSNNEGATWSIPNETSDMRFYAIGNHDGTMKQRRAYETIRLSCQIGNDTNASSISSTRFFQQA